MARISGRGTPQRALLLRDALLFVLGGTGQSRAGFGVLPVDVRHCRLPQKPGTARYLRHAAPVDRVLVETDAPYLAPPPYRGKRNEPAYTAHTARKGAEVFGMDYADFAAQTQANFDRLFTKAATYKAAA